MTTPWNHLQVLPSWNASFGVGTAGRAPCSPMKHTKCCATQVIYTAARQQQKTLAHHPIVDTFGPMKHTKKLVNPGHLYSCWAEQNPCTSLHCCDFMVPYDHRQAGNQTLCTHRGTQPVHTMVACINISNTDKARSPKSIGTQATSKLVNMPKT